MDQLERCPWPLSYNHQTDVFPDEWVPVLSWNQDYAPGCKTEHIFSKEGQRGETSLITRGIAQDT